jgi:hypothetical protein
VIFTLEVKGGKLRETKMFEKGFNQNDVLNVLSELNMRIIELEVQLDAEKNYSAKIEKELRKLKNAEKRLI